jgi:hypothetical protein
MCLISAPPCNPETSLPVEICEESCELYQHITAAQLCRVTEELLLQTSNNVQFTDLVDIFINFSCSEPSTYLLDNVYSGQTDLDVCTGLFSAEDRGKN